MLSPFNLAVTMGIGSATCAVFKGSLHGYQRLKVRVAVVCGFFTVLPWSALFCAVLCVCMAL